MYIGLHVKYPLFLSDFNETWIFSTLSKNIQILNVMKMNPVGAGLFHADGRTQREKDGRTDRHDEANSRFSQFCEGAIKLTGAREYCGLRRSVPFTVFFLTLR
jgi:hypothetical protein